jgi:transmembrane sensor
MRLMELGRRVAATQDQDRALLGAAEQAHASFIRTLRKRQHPVRTLLLAAAAIALLGGLSAVFLIPNRPITVAIGNSATSAALGASIAAPADREIPLQFSDGSTVALAPGSNAVIASLVRDGGTIRIEHGKAQIHVVHTPKSRWSVQAGPYTVIVTGTRFDIDWQPQQQQLVVKLREGHVVVSGHSSQPPAQMSAGQQLVVLVDTWTIGKLIEGPIPRPVASTDLVIKEAFPAATDVESRPSPAAALNEASNSPVRTTPSETWQTLAKHGDYRTAFEMAERDGFERICRSSSSSELLSLAEASRFAGHAERASQALVTLRNRFGGNEDAAVAAFQLGRLTTNGRQAADWFRTYLREQKRGDLAREASGRLLEALSRSGERVAARAAASDYLEVYPHGPHSAFARKLLNP